MALGALISAYQEASENGGELRATLPLAGRTLVEYQARLATLAGAAPIVVLVERMPAALIAAVDRLAAEGIRVQLARTVDEAAGSFERDDRVLIVAGGLFADAASIERVASADGPAILTLADNIGLDAFERIDVSSRWAGLAIASGAQVGDTASMLGEWDLQSTLLRRLVQDGARHLAAPSGAGAPLLLMAFGATDLDDAERRIVSSSRSRRRDWVERWVTPMLEEFAVERMMGTRVKPDWLIAGTLLLTGLGALFFARGWPVAALVALVLSVPLDSIAERLGALRMRPLASTGLLRRGLPWAAAAALTALGAHLAPGHAGWGALVTVAAALGFFRAAVLEQPAPGVVPPPWLASRKGAIVGAIPFAIIGWWTPALIAVALWAALSFFRLQAINHGGTLSKD